MMTMRDMIGLPRSTKQLLLMPLVGARHLLRGKRGRRLQRLAKVLENVRGLDREHPGPDEWRRAALRRLGGGDRFCRLVGRQRLRAGDLSKRDALVRIVHGTL